MYNIGEKVMHPTTGACIIEEITNMRVGGAKRAYYKLCPMLTSKATVYVPIASGKDSRIRPVITQEDLQNIGVEYEFTDYKWIVDNKERLKIVTAALKSTDFLENMLLIKMLKKRNQEKPLSYVDKKSLHEAQEMVYSELAMIKDRSYEDITNEMKGDSDLSSLFL